MRWKNLFFLAFLLAACGQNPQTQAPSPGPRLTAIGGEPAVAGEILVKYKPGLRPQSPAPLGESLAVQSLSDPAWGSLVRVKVPEGQEEAYIQAYSTRPEVEYAEPNYWVANPAREVLATLSLPQKPQGLKPQAYTDGVTDPYFLQVPPGDPLSATGADGTPYTNVPYLWGIYRIRAPEVWNQATGAREWWWQW